MKNTKLSIIALLLCGAMLFAMPGCEKDVDDEKDEDVVENEDGNDDKDDKDEGFKPAEYNGDNLFTNGLTPFRKNTNKSVGYVDASGKFIIKAKFSNAMPFASNGLACVEEFGQWGYIDTEGKYVIEPQFSYAESFDENGMAHVIGGGKHGFINEKGEWVIENKFTQIGEFAYNGLAAACMETDEGYKYGYIDKSGKTVIDFIYDEAYAFMPCGYARVYKDGKNFFITDKGNLAINDQFRYASDFGTKNMAFVAYDDGVTSGYIDVFGELIINIGQDKALVGDPLNEDCIGKVYAYGKAYLIKDFGETVIELKASEIGEFDENGLAIAKTSIQSYNYVNTDGEFLLSESARFCMPFANGLARVMVDNKWGYVDASGNVVIEPQFASATDFGADGYAIVAVADDEATVHHYAIIDKEGNYLIDFDK